MIALIAISLFLFSSASVAASPDLALYNAMKHGADVKIVLHVVNQDGDAIPGALITGGMTTGGGINDYSEVHGISDRHGVFTIKGKCTDFLRCTIEKDGYYSSEFKYYCYRKDISPVIVDKKWQPYGLFETIMLKEIINPQPMAFNGGQKSFTIPALGTWIGFDCLLFDFNYPFGHGEEADFLLRFTLLFWT